MKVSGKVSIKIFLICFAVFFFASACKKKKAFKEEDGQAATDARMAQGQNDEAYKDINIAIMEQSLLRGKGTAGAGNTEICGVTIDTLEIFQGVIKLNYQGKNCYGYTKTGIIRVSLEGYPLKKWKNPGSILKVEFIGYKVTRATDGRSVQLDGTQYITNESGSTFFDLRYLNVSSIVHTVTGFDMKVKFDGDNTAIFNVGRRMTYTHSGGVTTCRIEGTGSAAGKSNLENWGHTRNGDSFTSEVTVPIVWKTTCGAVAPLEGEVAIKVDKKDFELKCKFAVDETGESVSGDNPCPYGWLMEWSYKNRTNTRIFGYY
jgi:hypothetical protein